MVWRRSGLVAFVFGALIAAGPAPAVAQDGDEAPADEAIRTMHDFARCTVLRRRWVVARYVRAEPGSRESRRLALRAMDPNCLREGGRLRLRGRLARGMLFEALYRRAHSASPPAEVAAMPPLDYPLSESPVAGDVRIRNVALFRFGECVARAAPGEAHALLRTDPATPAEEAAFAPLMPHLSGCLAAGVELTFSRPVLRGLLAEALYRFRESEERE